MNKTERIDAYCRGKLDVPLSKVVFDWLNVPRNVRLMFYRYREYGSLENWNEQKRKFERKMSLWRWNVLAILFVSSIIEVFF